MQKRKIEIQTLNHHQVIIEASQAINLFKDPAKNRFDLILNGKGYQIDQQTFTKLNNL